MKKKILIFLTLLCMVVALLPANITVHAATSGTCGDNAKWTYDDGTLNITGTGAIVTGATSRYPYIYSMTEIPWYSYRRQIKTIIIGEGITDTGVCAFMECESLTSVTLPKSLATIGAYSFTDCRSLTNITIPNNVTCIYYGAFQRCTKLTNIIIPDTVNNIGRDAFSWCGIKNITIPNSVTSIAGDAFHGCESLTSITIPKNIISTSDWSFSGCSSLTSIEFPNNITTIGQFAFMGCESLTSITIPDSVTSIGSQAFHNCTSLKSITLSNNLISIGSNAFNNCSSLSTIIIPNSVTTIGEYIFYECNSLTSVTIGDNVKTIGVGAFYNCENLAELVWNAENVSDFNNKSDTFYNAGTNGNGINVIFGKNVKTIPDYLFFVNNASYRPKIDSVTIGKNVVSIGTRAFSYCSLTNIIIPNGVTSINSSAFYGCTGLTSIIIPDSVTSIGSDAFAYCAGLKSITISHGITELNDYTFYHCSALANISIPSGVTNIGRYTFSGCVGLTEITIPDSVTSIGGNAFSGCGGLTSITIPHSVTQIGTSAFSNCSGLTGINVDEGNKNYSSVDGNLFDKEKTELMQYIVGKSDMQYNIPDGITTIGSNAFAGCSNLTGVTIPKSVTYIGYSAFSKCDNLTNVYYNGTKSEWNNIAINSNYNTSLTNAKRTYFSYVKISDKDGKIVVDTTQNMGEAVDTSCITVPNGCALKLYKDKEMTEEYSSDTLISENLNLYYEIDGLNKLKITGTESADIGQKGITESVTFATDKTAKDFVATIKYSDKLNFVKANSEIFDIEADEYTDDGQKYLSLTCTYKNDGNMPKNTTLNAFDLVFDVSESATANEKLTIEFVNDETFLADGGATYDFDGLGTAEIKINPILVKSVTINGADEIDKATQYTAVILPENATNKDIEWLVDNSEIAKISADGILTPVKAGTVKIKATAKDGSGISSEKSVNVKVYAQITSLSASAGEWDKTFTPSEREYIIYVPKDTSSIKLTPTHDGTLLRETTKYYSGRAKSISLTDTETVLTLTYSETGYTDSEYKIKIVKFEGAKTTVSSDGTKFTIKPINIASGNTVILALYNGDTFVEMQSATYNGEDIPFTTDKAYTSAKVVVWNSLSDMTPICDVEIVK